jgi:hypothetical protein
MYSCKENARLFYFSVPIGREEPINNGIRDHLESSAVRVIFVTLFPEFATLELMGLMELTGLVCN